MTEETRQRDLIDHVLRSCPWLERSAWYPESRPVDEERDSRLCTRFGGKDPFRRDNFSWPVCGECGTLKLFMCQINIANLPPLLQKHIKIKSGLFQFFYCHVCMPDETFEDMYIIENPDLVPSLKSLAAEKVAALEEYDPMTLPPILRKFVEEYTESMGQGWEPDEAVVDGWTKKTELPKYEEVWDSDTDIAKKIKREANLTEEQYQSFVGQLSNDNFNDCFMTSGAKIVGRDTKVGGWFTWGNWSENEVMYLECPDCKVKMDITFLQVSDGEEYWGHPRYSRNGFLMLCPQCKKPGAFIVD